MLKLLTSSLFLILLFSFFSLLYAEDFERLCDEEILKNNIKISIVQDACLKTAEKFESEGDFGNASGYYLLADKQEKNIAYTKNKISKEASGIYSNIGHSYMIRGYFEEGKKYYKKFIESYHNPNIAMQNDFKELKALYPKYNQQLTKAKKIWDKLYKPLLDLDPLYNQLDYLKQSEESIVLLKKIIKIKEHYIPYTLSITSDYQSLALVFEEKFSLYDEALNLYSKILNIDLLLLGEEYFNTATAYYNIANILNLQAHYNEALYLYKKILKIDLKLLGEKHSETSSTYHNMANVYVNLQQFDKALELYQKSLDIYSNLLDKDNEYITATYQQMANVFNFKGDYNSALSLYNLALKIDLKNFPSNHLYIAGLYHNIGYTYNNKGDYINALKFYNKALDIDLKNFGEHHTTTATTLHSIGYVYHNLGNYVKALEYYKKVENIDLDLLGLYHPDTATTYHHIAYAYQEKKEYKKAEFFYRKALKIKEKILGKNHISTASTYHNLANIYEDLFDFKKALMYYNKTVKIEENILGEMHPNTANTYNNIGNLLNEMKKYNQALIYFQKALTINKKLLRENHPTISTNFHNIGMSYFYKKDFKNAYNNTLASFNIFLKNRRVILKSLDHLEKEKYLKSNQDIMRISHLFRTAWFYTPKKLSKKVFSYWLNYKGTLFEYQNILSMIQEKSKSKETQKAILDLKKLTLQQAKLGTTSPHKRTKEYKKEKKNIEEQIHNIEVNLSQQTPQFKEILNLSQIDSTLLSKLIKPNQLYIDFVRGEENYYLFTLDSNQHITFEQIDKNETIKIEKNIQAFRLNNQKVANAIEKNTLTKKLNQKLKKESQEILSTLYNSLFKKYLRTPTKDKNSLIISPDGLLNFFPFEALYHENHYLIEKYHIHYISSGRELIRQSQQKKRKNSKKIVIFGSPDFWLKLPKEKNSSNIKGNITQHNATIFDMEFPSLNISKREIDIMKKYYPKLKVYQDFNATVENLFKIKNPKILHISTHGFFLDNRDNPNPMLATGLAFAGANYANYKNDARGIATALQLSTLELYGTKLVVLSACETGLGKIAQAEGVTGLPKAFIQAGAKHVMMSLWRVSSQKTVTLMHYFYENIHKKENYAIALHNAKLQMINLHPYYWSAFIMSGI